MKMLILSLSATFGTLSGLFYDIHNPVISLATVSLSGPAIATAMAVFIITASLFLGLQAIQSRLETLITLQRRPSEPMHDIELPGISRLVAERAVPREAFAVNRERAKFPVIDLHNLDLRAER